MMKKLSVASTLALVLAPLGCGFAAAQTPLDKLLAQMDKSSASFKNATADVHAEVYLKVIHAVDTVQNGSTYFERDNGSIRTGMFLTTVGSSAKPQVIEYANGVLRNYTPGSKTLDIVKSSGDAGQALGFGGSGKDLARTWNITDMGPETIGGTTTEKLDLVPKDSKILKTFTHITIWIDPVRDVSMKQVLYQPSGDYRTVTYSNIVRDGKIDKRPYTIHTDKDTKVNQLN